MTLFYLLYLLGSANDTTGDNPLRRPIRPLAAARLPGVRQRRVQRHHQDQGRHQVRPG